MLEVSWIEWRLAIECVHSGDKIEYSGTGIPPPSPRSSMAWQRIFSMGQKRRQSGDGSQIRQISNSATMERNKRTIKLFALTTLKKRREEVLRRGSDGITTDDWWRQGALRGKGMRQHDGVEDMYNADETEEGAFGDENAAR